MTIYTPYPTRLQRRGKHDGFVSLSSNGNGSYLMSYQHGGTQETDASANTIVLRRSTDGVNWSEYEIVHSEVPTYAVKGSNLTLTSSGTVLLMFNRTSEDGEGGTNKEGVYVIRSVDYAQSWGSVIQIVDAVRTPAQGGPIVEKDDGTLIAPIYRAYAGFNHAEYMQSSDGGLTWDNVVTIADGSGSGLSFVEPNIVILANGTWLCLIRCTTDLNIYQTTSPDGVTWSAPTIAFEGNGAPRVVQLSDDTVVCVYRAKNFAGLRTSDDNGATWSEALNLFPDGGKQTYGDVLELPGSQVGIGFGIFYANGDCSVHYKMLDFDELP